MTENDYPPFNHEGPDGNPVGLNVDLARLVCEELRLSCTIQVRRWDTLVPALEANQGDVVIASLRVTPDLRRRVDVTDPYYRQPARFVGRRDRAFDDDATPERLAGRTVAVVENTAHEAYLATFFPDVVRRGFQTAEAARAALLRGEVDLLFGDGIASAVWLNGAASQACCRFVGGPFLESRWFGEGIGMLVRRGNEPLRRALDYALFRVWERGLHTDLWLRYFPVSPF